MEMGDVVFVQLPTENGYHYEQRLINKIRGYHNTKIVLVLHEVQTAYLNMCKDADAIVVCTKKDAKFLREKL